MDDLISRQAAIDVIEKTIKANESIHYEMKYWKEGMTCAKEIVEDLPSAERHGRWIENETSYADPPTKQTCNCSICGKASTRPLGDWCRWCGSRMDLDGDTE